MIEIIVTKHTYDGDAATTTFPYDFRIDHKTHLKVWVDDVLKAEGTHYTVSNVGEDDGGTVTFVTAPPVGTGNVVLERDSPEKQLVQLLALGPMMTEEIERNMADKLCMMIQELVTKFGTPVAGEFVKWDDRAQDFVTGEPDTGLFERFNAIVVTQGDSFKDLTFTTPADDNTYAMTVMTNWNTTWSIPDLQKLASGFRIEFGTEAPVDAKIWVRVYV